MSDINIFQRLQIFHAIMGGFLPDFGGIHLPSSQASRHSTPGLAQNTVNFFQINQSNAGRDLALMQSEPEEC